MHCNRICIQVGHCKSASANCQNSASVSVQQMPPAQALLHFTNSNAIIQAPPAHNDDVPPHRIPTLDSTLRASTQVPPQTSMSNTPPTRLQVHWSVHHPTTRHTVNTRPFLCHCYRHHGASDGTERPSPNTLLWSPPSRRCLSHPPGLLACFIQLCSASAASNSATCPYVGHGSQPTLQAPREGLRQGEVRGGEETLGSETKCCAPAGRCGTPRIPDPGGSVYTQNKELQITSDNHYIYPATLREVGPLNNNERGPHLPP